MEQAAQTDRLLRRNLKDAGCGAADIERFLQLGQEGKRPEQLRLLRQHRAAPKLSSPFCKKCFGSF